MELYSTNVKLSNSMDPLWAIEVLLNYIMY